MVLGFRKWVGIFAIATGFGASAVAAQQAPNLDQLTLTRLNAAISALERVALGLSPTVVAASPLTTETAEAVSDNPQRPAFIRRNNAPKCFGNIDQPREKVEELEADLSTFQNAAKRTSVFLKQFQEISLLDSASGDEGKTCSDFQKAVLAEAQKSFQTVKMNELNGLALHLQYCRVTENDVYLNGDPVDADALATTAQDMIFLLLDARQQLAEAREGCP